MQLLKLVANMVKLGEPLPWGVRDAQGKLLLAQGQVITDPEQLSAMIDRGGFVHVEEAREAVKRAAELQKQRQQQQRPVNLFTLWEREMWQLDRLLRSTEEAGFVARAEEVVEQLVALTDRDPDIAIYLCVRQDPKRLSIYGLAHSIHCALIALLVGRKLGWDAGNSPIHAVRGVGYRLAEEMPTGVESPESPASPSSLSSLASPSSLSSPSPCRAFLFRASSFRACRAGATPRQEREDGA